MYTIVALSRAERFSPNSVEKDAAILGCVCNELRHCGCDVEIREEANLDVSANVSLIISMGRLPQTLHGLTNMENSGVKVVNTPSSVALCCNRRQLNNVLKAAGIPLAPEKGEHGYWLKRADGVAESSGDVQYASDEVEAQAKEKQMREAGVADVLVCAHVPGDLIKFYGVRDTDFFRYYYPGDDGKWKFSDEARNGKPQHFPFSANDLHTISDKAAAAAGLDVYGGDCIVREDGTFCIIDLNDWPSFSRCREEAAKAIAGKVCKLMSW